MDLYFARGDETKVLRSLRSNQITSKCLRLVEAKHDRDALVLLLCNVVFCRTQYNIKTDIAVEAIGGTNTDNIDNAPRRIKKFAAWLGHLIANNFDLANDNTIGDVIPKLDQIAITVSLAITTARQFVKDRNRLYLEALNSVVSFMEAKTGKPNYPAISKLLEESALALRKNQTYGAHEILVRMKDFRSQ